MSVVGTFQNHIIFQFRLFLTNEFKDKMNCYYKENIVRPEAQLRLNKLANPFKLSSWFINTPSRSSQKKCIINSELIKCQNDSIKFLETVFPIIIKMNCSTPMVVNVNTNIFPDTTYLELFYHSIGFVDFFTMYLFDAKVAWQYDGNDICYRLFNRERVKSFDSIYLDDDYPDSEFVPYYFILKSVKLYTEFVYKRIREFQNKTKNSLRKNVDSDFIEIQELYYRTNRMITDVNQTIDNSILANSFGVANNCIRVKRFSKQICWLNDSLNQLGSALDEEINSIATLINLKQTVYSRKLNRRVFGLTFITVILGIIQICSSIKVDENKTLLEQMIGFVIN